MYLHLCLHECIYSRYISVAAVHIQTGYIIGVYIMFTIMFFLCLRDVFSRARKCIEVDLQADLFAIAMLSFER